NSNNFYFIYGTIDIIAQKFDVNGNIPWGAAGVLVNENSTGGEKDFIPLQNGAIAVVWRHNAAINDANIYSQVISSIGEPLLVDIPVSTSLNIDEQFPGVAKADGSNFYIVYAQETASNIFDIKVQKYSELGVNLF